MSYMYIFFLRRSYSIEKRKTFLYPSSCSLNNNMSCYLSRISNRKRRQCVSYLKKKRFICGGYDMGLFSVYLFKKLPSSFLFFTLLE